MIDVNDIAIIRAAILQDVPAEQKPLVNATVNIAIHTVELLERFVVAQETIAASQSKEFAKNVIHVVNDYLIRGGRLPPSTPSA